MWPEKFQELDPSWETNSCSSIQDIPTFHDTVFTRARHLLSSWAKWIEFTPSHTYFFKSHFNIILSTPRSSWALLCFRFSYKTLYAFLFHVCYIPSSSQPPWVHIVIICCIMHQILRRWNQSGWGWRSV
jgi:hypothetical protein